MNPLIPFHLPRLMSPIQLLVPLLFVGCLNELTNSDGTLEFSGVAANVTATPSQKAVFSGSVSASDGLDSIVTSVTNPDGTSGGKSSKGLGGSTDFNLSGIHFGVTASDCNGTYSIRIAAYSGSKEKAETVNVVVTGAKTCGTAAANVSVFTGLTLGAQDNATLGSSIDLDAPAVLKATPARAAASTIDLVYIYSFGTDSDKLCSPNFAQSNVTFMTGWSVYNRTKFHLVSGVSFSEITTKSELEGLWNASQAVTTSLDVEAGDLVIAYTDQGVYALIDIVSKVGGGDGQIQVKVAK